MKLPPSLRKAAVLVSALDERTAEAILESMTPDESAKVRSALMELDDISADEQSRVLAEFMRQQGTPALVAESEGDVELELSPATVARVNESASAMAQESPAHVAAANEPPLAFLTQVPAGALANVLRGEHPQTAAVVIAQLPPQLAAQVLEALPPNLATDALERMAWLGEVSPEVEADLARELRQVLTPHMRAAAADALSLAHLAAVLDAMGGRQRRRTLQQLAERNTTLGERLGVRSAAPARAARETDAALAFRYRLGPKLPGDAPERGAEHESTSEAPQRFRFAATV